MGTGLKTTNGNPSAPPYSSDVYNWDTLLRTKPGLCSVSRYALEETFQRLPSLNASIGVATNLDFEVLGTNASADDVTHSATRAGIQCQTDGATNDSVIILPHLDASQSAWTGIKWGTENQVHWEAVLTTGASIAAVTFWAGLKLTNVDTVATDNDQVYFRYDAGIGNWEAVASIGGTDVEFDTNVALAANTTYHFRIEIDKNRIAKMYINDAHVYTTGALTNDVDLIPYVGVKTNTGSAVKELILHREAISRILFE